MVVTDVTQAVQATLLGQATLLAQVASALVADDHASAQVVIQVAQAAKIVVQAVAAQDVKDSADATSAQAVTVVVQVLALDQLQKHQLLKKRHLQHLKLLDLSEVVSDFVKFLSVVNPINFRLNNAMRVAFGESNEVVDYIRL